MMKKKLLCISVLFAALPEAPSFSLSWQGYGFIFLIMACIALLVWAFMAYRKKRRLQRVALSELAKLKPEHPFYLAKA